MKKLYLYNLTGLFFALSLFTSCAGEDKDLLFFPPPVLETPAPPSASAASEKSCDVTFTSQLCVSILGENISVGVDEGEELCAEVAGFPLHIRNGKISLKGSEFPDVEVSGHGLPAPITLNGKGSDSGENNIGEGTIDNAGNITINNFSFYINVLNASVEIPGFTLTTGSTSALDYLPAISGHSTDGSGAIKLVMAKTLGHTIDAADEFLLGASMQASFTGTVNPSLGECGDKDAPKALEVKQITFNTDGSKTEAALPDGNKLNISNGTYLSSDTHQVGSKYESSAHFRIRNTSSKSVAIKIPARKGSFLFHSDSSLTTELASKKSLFLDVTFRPKQNVALPGENKETLLIGTELFEITGIALEESGDLSLAEVNDDGSIGRENVQELELGNVDVVTSPQRGFFKCEKITCNDTEIIHQCTTCGDPSQEACELLPISTEQTPLGEVDADCKPLRPLEKPLTVIDINETGKISLSSQQSIVAVRNLGTKSITITEVTVEALSGTHANGEFTLLPGSIFLASEYAEAQKKINELTQQSNVRSALPLSLPPYEKGRNEVTAYIAILYHPKDLRGSNGSEAGIGSSTIDKAKITIKTEEDKNRSVIVQGSTSLFSIPALELYIKDPLSLKQIAHNQAYPFSGITQEIEDISVPLFLKLSDAAASPTRITSITISGNDADHFELLDTKEKIDSVQTVAGKKLHCSIPSFDPNSGELMSESFDLKPVKINAPGYDLSPGEYTTENMPLFGCIRFKKTSDSTQKSFEAELTVNAIELDNSKQPARNADGSPKESTLVIKLMAAVNPLKGKMVFRITQTLSVILTGDNSIVTGIDAYKEMKKNIDAGRAKKSDTQVFLSSVLLDPFDEITMKDSSGEEILSIPQDGITAVFRAVDNHVVDSKYGNEFLYDYINFPFDASRPEGQKGIFEDYPNVPEDTKVNGWRIFTSALSYPGPLAEREDLPNYPSECEIVDPCSKEGFIKYTKAGIGSDGKGACAFFYASAGKFDSPAFHAADELPGGMYQRMCNQVNQKQNILDVNTGRYQLNGQITFEEIGFRLFGPNFVHIPAPYGPVPGAKELDEIFHTAFTTGTLKPQENAEEPNVLPDEHIDISKKMYKINLDDKKHVNPPICNNNVSNRRYGNITASSWKYLKPYISLDEEGEKPAGCPSEPGENYAGGTAFLHGLPLDPDTHKISFVTAVRFKSSPELTFVFNDVMNFFVLNGWMCDPTGSEENFEGERCYDVELNDRDASTQVSILDE
ncbi:MAG: hypothetical protein COX62_00410 [Deltaproteobacteria bacterium CG_4_10_14_0_2_um_filter_43_8]|nr:MAG: hypothetical protein COV43_09665 [Deltaproteobacteria bacterium CG11_big_fil_rev_8_21_14_0_20_42_23]PJA22241.1 MAG: hypothetical protein COX62_00410 [Deltaproteobacteria bacterium CG_4_10_14_0_2_um_filter_43_8]PJC64314.1 MAG: hypothetical protein CO021_04740 [Deltaproteobacteria bacterium CG_4_9_14_0_2_um_filter_42_21]